MSFLKHLDTGEDKEGECHGERIELINDYCSIEELRYVSTNFKKLISEKVSFISERMKTNSLTQEDFRVFNGLSRIKPVYDGNFRPDLIFYIKNASKVVISGKTLYALPIRLELIETNPPAPSRNGWASVCEDIVLFRTVVILEKDDYVKLKLKSNENDSTSIIANNF